MRTICFLLGCLLAVHASAQRPLSLEEAISTSLANNYDIRLSRNDSSLAALDYAFSNYAFYPRLSANAAPTSEKSGPTTSGASVETAASSRK